MLYNLTVFIRISSSLRQVYDLVFLTVFFPGSGPLYAPERGMFRIFRRNLLRMPRAPEAR